MSSAGPASMANGEHGHLLLCRQQLLILVDHYSDYWEIDQLSDLSAHMLITRCRAKFARYGQPDKVITDNGPQFMCEQFRQFAANWGLTYVTSSPSHSKIKRQDRSSCENSEINWPPEGVVSRPSHHLKWKGSNQIKHVYSTS